MFSSHPSCLKLFAVKKRYFVRLVHGWVSMLFQFIVVNLEGIEKVARLKKTSEINFLSEEGDVSRAMQNSHFFLFWTGKTPLKCSCCCRNYILKKTDSFSDWSHYNLQVSRNTGAQNSDSNFSLRLENGGNEKWIETGKRNGGNEKWITHSKYSLYVWAKFGTRSNRTTIQSLKVLNNQIWLLQISKVWDNMLIWYWRP